MGKYYPQKYSKDGGNKVTIRNIAQAIMAKTLVGEEAVCDVIDELFLHGAWLHITIDIENIPDGKLFLRDLRGLLLALATKEDTKDGY